MGRLIGATARRLSLSVLVTFLYMAGVTNADFVFGEPVNLGPTVNTEYSEVGHAIPADGLSLYFASDRTGGSGKHDLWMMTRETTSDPWGEPVNLGPTVNSSIFDTYPAISADGRSLYFASDRAWGQGNWDLWMTTRETTSDPWGEPVNLGPTVNSTADEIGPNISADGLELYFSGYLVARPGGYGNADLWVTTRSTKDDPWGTPVNLGGTVNSSSYDISPFVLPDGLMLCFYSYRPGGYGEADIWMTRRATDSDPWEEPVNLGPTINTPFRDGKPSFSANGSTLYFASDRPGGSGGNDLWQASVIPIVDLNGDELVDMADIDIMIDCWGTDDSLCDIGPMPWGDGIVDVEDLIVLVERIVEAKADADAVE